MHSHALLVALACVQGCFISGALCLGWRSLGSFGGHWQGFAELVLMLNCGDFVGIAVAMFSGLGYLCRKVCIGWRCCIT